MKESEQKAAARAFAEKWKGRGYEKGETHSFWIELLRTVYDVQDPESFIVFEEQVDLSHKSFIDATIPETHVMIEQKSIGKDLSKAIKQSDGTILTPYQQAKRYAAELPYSQRPRWIVACNFEEFRVYNMENPQAEPEIILLKDLPKEYYRLQFLVNVQSRDAKKEMEISLAAGEIVGKLYDALLKQYKDPTNEESLKNLNKLCVRLVFCLYAEDAGIFGKRNMFHDYLKTFREKNIRKALIDLFEVLATPEEKRDLYMDKDLAAFPYVNGGLFEEEKIEIPNFTDEILNLLLHHASEDFDWSGISPTIFGAVFESTLNPETRRAGGMHYTSIENIHKVIDPLFLDDLKKELETIKEYKRPKDKQQKLLEFQKKLASLTFLDPASGSGNFLTETYISLRRLENEALREQFGVEMVLGDLDNPIQVSIHQFYGIEINDFAVTVAKTALWIAEAQMMEETKNIVHMDIDFLPLKTYANIIEGNALRMDWDEVVPKNKVNYIMGNPPFVGLSLRSKEQQEDMAAVFFDNERSGRLDYVAAWYKKAARYMQETSIQAAFVSTNSITQGEQVPILWDDILNKQNMFINFAHRTFVWNSESTEKAAVHCVIIGFSAKERTVKILFEGNNFSYVSKINGYLVEADSVMIQLRGKAQAGFPKLVQGNKPWDGKNLILSIAERDDMIKKYPQTEQFIKPYIGSKEFINNLRRYCLWLKDVSPSEYRNIPEIKHRLEAVAKVRRETKTVAVQAQAETPMLFSQIRQPNSDYIMIPETSSSNRRYIPIGFMTKDVIASNSTLVAADATMYLFGVLTSNVHMSWVRTLCGRLKSDYRYSPSIYNNFPWPTPIDEQRVKIEQTAQGILDARAKFPNASLADLYDEITMPPELRKAHQENDRAVMQAYGFDVKNMTEAACVAELMKMYQELAETKS